MNHVYSFPYTDMPAANSKINDSAAYESLYVHKVYDQIASHFSATRYKVCSRLLLALYLGVDILS